MDSRNVVLGVFVALTLIFASVAALEYSRGPSISTTTRTSFSISTSTATTTTTTTIASTTSLVSVSTVTATNTAGFALSVRVDRQDYTTNQSILVNGTVSPPPISPSSVTLIVTGPNGVAATANSEVSMTNGSYSYTFLAGGSPAWVVGAYTVTAICTESGATEAATAQFSFAVPV